MSARDQDLGRRRGVFIPVGEIEAHLFCGWEVVDDLAGDPLGRDFVLVRSPADVARRDGGRNYGGRHEAVAMGIIP